MVLEEKNKHVRDERIQFEEEPHLYYIDGSCDGYISVTTLIHKFFREFDADKIIDKMMRSPVWYRSKYFGMTKNEIKEQWEDNRNESALLGTKLHSDIENFYNKVKIKNDSKEFDYFMKYYEEHKDLKPYRTEWCVFNERLKLAGSIDMIYIDNNGDYHLCDWKRSKEIKLKNLFDKGLYPLSHIDDANFFHYSLQLNIYKRILKVNYNIDIKSMFLVQLHPNQETYKKYMCVDLEEEVDSIFIERMAELRKK